MGEEKAEEGDARCVGRRKKVTALIPSSRDHRPDSVSGRLSTIRVRRRHPKTAPCLRGASLPARNRCPANLSGGNLRRNRSLARAETTLPNCRPQLAGSKNRLGNSGPCLSYLIKGDRAISRGAVAV
jgi:hypothetical protein